MNEDVYKRFAVACEVVFTTQQDMDEFDVERSFETELSEQWDGLHDLDFESVRTLSVNELPAEMEQYAKFIQRRLLGSKD